MIALLLTCIYTQAQRVPGNIQKSLLVFSPLHLLWILTGLQRDAVILTHFYFCAEWIPADIFSVPPFAHRGG